MEPLFINEINGPNITFGAKKFPERENVKILRKSGPDFQEDCPRN